LNSQFLFSLTIFNSIATFYVLGNFNELYKEGHENVQLYA